MKRLAISMILLVATLATGCGEGLPEQHLAATREGQRVAVEVEATKQHLNHEATAQAVAISATATAAAVQSEDERLRLEKRRARQPVSTWGPVLAVLVAAMGCVWMGWKFAHVAEDRARLVRRRPDEGESIIILPGGERFVLPMRHPTSSSDRLADAEAQDRATMRQQTANALQARQAAKIVAARHGQDTTRKVMMIPAPQSRRALRRPGTQESGLVGVAQLNELDGAIESGMLPKQLADAIDTEWQEVKRDD